MKLSPVSKIALSGLLLALTIIFTRFLSIQNIPVIPFVRISIGPALIIFASIFLGPIYGGVIGGASDILGIFLVPNALGYSINPWFTLVYTILGIVPWFIYKLFKLIKNQKITFAILIATFIALWVFVLIYGLTHERIRDVEITTLFRILVISISFVLTALTVIGLYFINKKYKDSDINISNIALTALICEVAIMLIGNSIVKSIFFEVNILIVLFFQAIVFFIDIPLNTIVISYLLKIANKVFYKKDSL